MKCKPLWITLLVLAIIGLGVGAGAGVFYWTSGNVALPTQRAEVTVVPEDAAPTPGQPDGPTEQEVLPDNPVDFAALQATNPDIYAWIHIPDTNVDDPVACSSPDKADDFYLNHNIYGQYEFAGTLYSEKQNGTDLSDRNTVIYGHNMLNGTMFRTLHYFEDKEFFDQHETFTIYTPGHILTYTIFAAYQYDNRHILNSFDFEDDAVWAEYLAYATDPKTMNVNTREVEVTVDDRIVTLSTCVGTNKSARYLVQGVLTDDQPTN